MGASGIFLINPKSREKYQYTSGDLRHVEEGTIVVGATERRFAMREFEKLVR
jgi:hypothetical protein